jgi:hypothetical protein
MVDTREALPGSGWFLSPTGVPAYADGASQARAYVGRGYTEMSDDEAKELIGDGIRLHVSRADAKGTFDADQVDRAVREEGGQPSARAKARMTAIKRSEAARKAAATRAAHKAAEGKDSNDSEG